MSGTTTVTGTVFTIPAPIDQPMQPRLVTLVMPPTTAPPPQSMAAAVAGVLASLTAGSTVTAGNLATLRQAAITMANGQRRQPTKDLTQLVVNAMPVGSTATALQLTAINECLLTLAEMQPSAG